MGAEYEYSDEYELYTCSCCGRAKGSFHMEECEYIAEAEFTMVITDVKDVPPRPNVTHQGATYKEARETMRFYRSRR